MMRVSGTVAVRGVASAAVVVMLMGAQAASAAAPASGASSAPPVEAKVIDPFNFVAPTVCGMNISTKEAFDQLMQKYAFKKSADGQWWWYAGSTGTTKVFGMLPAKQAMVVFVPSQSQPLQASIIQAMTTKAENITLVPPDKLSFSFAVTSKLAGCTTSNEVIVSLTDGSWLETDQTVSWGGQP